MLLFTFVVMVKKFMVTFLISILFYSFPHIVFELEFSHENLKKIKNIFCNNLPGNILNTYYNNIIIIIKLNNY